MGSILARFLWVGLTAYGAARWTSIEAAFVRKGLLQEREFFRDLAISQTLPGPAMINLTALCGMRLGGVRVAVAATALVLLPGLLAMIAALAWLNTADQWVAHLLHGILVAAVGVSAASFWRAAARLSGLFAPSIAATILLLIALGAPMIVAVIGVGVIGVARYRWSPQTLP